MPLDPIASFDWISFLRMVSPWLVLFAAAMVILLASAFVQESGEFLAPLLSLVAVVIAFLLSWQLWLAGTRLVSGMLVFDRITFLGWMLVLLASALALLLSPAYLKERALAIPEYYVLILISVMGMGCLIAGSDLLTVFLGLEVMSVAVYALTGFFRICPEGNEAALKYFLTGAFASAFLLMGIAFFFGSAGTTDITLLAGRSHEILSGGGRSFFLFGMAMVIIGFGFKVAAVPFHAWAPDVYDGAPTPVTSFMATAVKAAAFIPFLRIGAGVLSSAGDVWIHIVWVGAVATMFVGNLAAIVQDNLKRMLAYSSIAHAGYLLITFPSLTSNAGAAASALGFYLVAYILMTAGAFAVVVSVQTKNESADISRLAGLSVRRPWAAACLTLFLLSLAGFPPTVGFFAKYYLFLGAIRAGFVWLVVVALINSAISAYYYLRPIVVMYFHPAKEGHVGEQVFPTAASVVAVIAITALGVLFFGCFPSDLLAIVEHSVF